MVALHTLRVKIRITNALVRRNWHGGRQEGLYSRPSAVRRREPEARGHRDEDVPADRSCRTHVEFLIPRRPVSLQTNNRKGFQAWKDFVRQQAARAWGDREMIEAGELRLSLVYLCRDSPLDVDNIIKPIQDALEGLAMSNDILVTDVAGHRRLLAGRFDLERLPPLLGLALASPAECVYVRLGDSVALEDLL